MPSIGDLAFVQAESCVWQTQATDILTHAPSHGLVVVVLRLGIFNRSFSSLQAKVLTRDGVGWVFERNLKEHE